MSWNMPEGCNVRDIPGWDDPDDFDAQNERQERLEEQARVLWQDNATVAAWMRDYERDHDCTEFASIVRALCEGKPVQATLAAERIKRDFLLDYCERQS